MMDIDDLKDLDDETRKKVEELSKITREKDGNNTYAEAQFRIGKLLNENNKIRDALAAWDNIKETDSREIFIPAQWNI